MLLIIDHKFKIGKNSILKKIFNITDVSLAEDNKFHQQTSVLSSLARFCQRAFSLLQ